MWITSMGNHGAAGGGGGGVVVVVVVGGGGGGISECRRSCCSSLHQDFFSYHQGWHVFTPSYKFTDPADSTLKTHLGLFQYKDTI